MPSGIGVGYAQLIKLYEGDSEGEKRHSPARCTGTEEYPIIGHPDDEHAAIYWARQYLLQEVGKPKMCSGAAFHVLQLRP